MSEERRTAKERRQVKCKARATYLERQRLGLDIVECEEIRKYLTKQPMCEGCPGAATERRSGEERRG